VLNANRAEEVRPTQVFPSFTVQQKVKNYLLQDLILKKTFVNSISMEYSMPSPTEGEAADLTRGTIRVPMAKESITQTIQIGAQLLVVHRV